MMNMSANEEEVLLKIVAGANEYYIDERIYELLLSRYFITNYNLPLSSYQYTLFSQFVFNRNANQLIKDRFDSIFSPEKTEKFKETFSNYKLTYEYIYLTEPLIEFEYNDSIYFLRSQELKKCHDVFFDTLETEDDDDEYEDMLLKLSHFAFYGPIGDICLRSITQKHSIDEVREKYIKTFTNLKNSI